MANGIIRRLDSLGRIVIPVNIRKKINLLENDSVEIFLDEQNQIILSKHSTLQGSKMVYEKICESITKLIGGTVLIVDSDQIVTSYGDKRMSYRPNSFISLEMVRRLERNEDISSNNQIQAGINEEETNISLPIIGENSRHIGSLIFIGSMNVIQNNRSLLSSYAIFISEMIKN